MAKIRIAGTESNSIVDGPGVRFVIFTQGCPHHCEGCHNPQTWSYEGGIEVDTNDLLHSIVSDPIISGVTFSGGEPYLQATLLAPLAKELRECGYNLWAYTGYLWDTVGKNVLTRYLDAVVDGRFELPLKTLDTPFRGSSNQRIIDVQRSIRGGHIIMLPVEVDR